MSKLKAGDNVLVDFGDDAHVPHVLIEFIEPGTNGWELWETTPDGKDIGEYWVHPNDKLEG